MLPIQLALAVAILVQMLNGNSLSCTKLHIGLGCAVGYIDLDD